MATRITVHLLNGEVVEGTTISDYILMNISDLLNRGIPFNLTSIGGVCVKTIVILSKNVNYIEIQELRRSQGLSEYASS